MALRTLPDREYVRECLDYDQDTGKFRWRVRPVGHFPKRPMRDCVAWNANYAGKIAGSRHSKNTIRIVIDRHIFYAHRLAWLIAHGFPVPAIIDHIDGDPANNRIGNLRAAKNGDNTANARIPKNNRLGVKGVRLHKHGTFEARVGGGGRSHYLGHFTTLEEAVKARRDAAERLHGKFARHE